MQRTYKNRKSRVLPAGKQLKFLNLKAEDVTRTFILGNLVATDKGEAEFNSWDLIELSKEKLQYAGSTLHLHKNFPDKPFTTTIGCYLTNLLLFDKVRRVTEYMNVTFNGKVIGGLNDRMVFLLLDEKINTDQYADFTDRLQWLGLGFARYFTPSFDTDTLVTRPEIKKRREELLNANADMFETGDVAKASSIRNQLIDEAKELMDKEKFVGYELFESGVAKFGNHYANVSIMRGALPKSSGKNEEFNILRNALNEGIPKNEIAPMGDLTVLASFSRSVNTQIGGYFGKKFIAAFQHLVLGEPGSDCKTKFFDTRLITKKNIGDYHLSYVRLVGEKKWILLDGDKFDTYTDKTLEIRSPKFCKDIHTCSKCAGELYYRMGIKNVGLLTGRIASKILNASLKFFHDVSTKYSDINLNGGLSPVTNMKRVTKKQK